MFSGFTGDHCETEFNFCSGVNCNGGTCVNGADAAVCICPYGKEGDRCDKGTNNYTIKHFVVEIL